MRRKATVRELHLKTSEIVKHVVNGETYVIEKHGNPVAEIRPVQDVEQTSKLPDREDFLLGLSFTAKDSGEILAEDRF